MMGNDNIIARYAEAGIDGRINIILNHYQDFPRIIKASEESLMELVISEKRYNRRAAYENPGVRVDSTRCSDPTASAALERIDTMDAIHNMDDLERVLEGTDCPERHRWEAWTLRDMREDYRLVSLQIDSLSAGQRRDIVRYLDGAMDVPAISEERQCTYGAARNRIWGIRRTIKSKARYYLAAKYER